MQPFTFIDNCIISAPYKNNNVLLEINNKYINKYFALKPALLVLLIKTNEQINKLIFCIETCIISASY